MDMSLQAVDPTQGHVVKFTINVPKTGNLKADGTSNVSLSNSDFKLPSNIDLPEGITNLHDLYNAVGEDNIVMEYQMRLQGNVSSHDCWATYVVYGRVRFDNNSYSPNGYLAETSGDPGDGGPVNTSWKTISGYSNNLVKSFSTSQECHGSGCWCKFESKDGWSNTVSYLRVNVAVDLLSFCIKPGENNINSNICYNYVSNYLTQPDSSGNPKPSQQISDYLATYCANKFEGATLSDLEDRENVSDIDRNLCACNMPQELYDEFGDSLRRRFSALDLTSIRPNCLVPLCYLSPFKPVKLDNCPVPQCLNAVTLDGNNISGDVNVNQNQQCSSIGITVDSRDGGGGGNVPVGPDGNPIQPSFWARNLWLIVAVVILLVVALLVILGVVFW